MEELKKSEFKTITLDELEKIGLVTADVFTILNQTKKEIILLRAGEYILPEFIDKYRAKGITSFYQRSNFDLLENDLWKKLWSQILIGESLDEYELYKIRKEYIKQLKLVFFDGEIKASLLSYTSITHQQFVGLSLEFMSQYAEKNYLLFKRSILVASLSLPLVISLGYNDPSFLKDLYNITLLLSYHLAQDKFTITIKNALTLESMEQGLGLKYLKLKSPKEVDCLSQLVDVTQSSEVSYIYQNEQIKDLLYFYQASFKSESTNSLSIEYDMPDWVSAVLLIDKIISYEDFNFQPNDATGYLKKILEKHLDVRFKKIRNVLESFWGVSLSSEKKIA